MPLFLNASAPAAAMHNSPPHAGPGSLAEPLIVGRRSRHAFAAMQTDAYYTSPVNPTNPVLVWTDGTRLFLAPAGGQVATGRLTSEPEPALSLPPGYIAEELHWDRVTGLTTGGGSLVVIARKPGAEDIEVAISNCLTQTMHFSGVGLTSSASGSVSREGAEFTKVDDSTIPQEFSEAESVGAIHQENFAEGFFRYRSATGDHDLYVAQGDRPSAFLVDRSSGDILRRFAAGSIAAVVPQESGVVHLEQTITSAQGTTQSSTVTIDLRTSPPDIQTTAGHASAEPDYADARTRLEGLGVAIHETGLRFRVAELEAIEQALLDSGGWGQTALVQFRTLLGKTATDPLLEVSKSIGPDAGYGIADATLGAALFLTEPFENLDSDRVTTIRHEMTHIIMDAVNAVQHSTLTRQQQADLEGAMRYEARRAQQKAQAGLLRSGEYGAGDRVPAVGSASEWRSAMASDPELASLWVELLRRYSFISDPEGTREFRGVSLADESRYAGVIERIGHLADSVSEFVASFVTCATLFHSQFVADVLAAETAGNAKGGGGGSYLRRLYRRVWSRISSRYVPLGANPF